MIIRKNHTTSFSKQLVSIYPSILPTPPPSLPLHTYPLWAPYLSLSLSLSCTVQDAVVDAYIMPRRSLSWCYHPPFLPPLQNNTTHGKLMMKSLTNQKQCILVLKQEVSLLHFTITSTQCLHSRHCFLHQTCCKECYTLYQELTLYM